MSFLPNSLGKFLEGLDSADYGLRLFLLANWNADLGVGPKLAFLRKRMAFILSAVPKIVLSLLLNGALFLVFYRSRGMLSSFISTGVC